MIYKSQQKVQAFIESVLKKGISQQAFDTLAVYLLYKCQLCLDDRIYYLTEIEFYCHEKENKKDAWHDLSIYAKKYELNPDRQKEWEKAKKFQSQFGLFFPHDAGIDFTFGNATRYGGILLRGIRPQEDENEDPCLQYCPSQVRAKLKQSKTISMEESPVERAGIVFQGSRVNIKTDFRPLRYAVNLKNRTGKETLVLGALLSGRLKGKKDPLAGTGFEKWWGIYQAITK